MAKKRKSSSNSRLTTKAPISAPMVIKAPALVVAPLPTTEISTPAPEASVSSQAASTPSPKSEIIVDRKAVAQLAFGKFVARGYAHGHAVEDWLAAEAELRTRMAQQSE